ncbi:RlpA-like double-psi beta-barrel-protein domain-containing protein-containing protein [Scheffersomyces coipomensis]|uniref:RlpA-like double-psi beta-barrel-protein domain-containing protein-containing protein n=1 Tax=Scheffersomyces coipomensis TaxID=1788519 RepID=UPI00315D2D7F
MKFSTITIIGGLITAVASMPVPEIVYVTEYHTVTITDGEENLAIPTTLATAATSSIEQDLNIGGVVSDVVSLFDFNPDETTTPTTFAAPSTTELATTTTTSAPSPVEQAPTITTTSTPSSTSSTSPVPSGSAFSGQGTYYSTGLGACGWTNQDTDYICAISHDLYDANNVNANPNDNSLCGKKIRATYQSNSVEVTVVDRCTGCQYYDLDFSPSAFSQLADQSLGRIDIEWEWV